jgi:hypothetical protein
MNTEIPGSRATPAVPEPQTPPTPPEKPLVGVGPRNLGRAQTDQPENNVQDEPYKHAVRPAHPQPKDQDPTRQIEVSTPAVAPVLTAGAARVLLRILLRAAEMQGVVLPEPDD